MSTFLVFGFISETEGDSAVRKWMSGNPICIHVFRRPFLSYESLTPSVPLEKQDNVLAEYSGIGQGGHAAEFFVPVFPQGVDGNVGQVVQVCVQGVGHGLTDAADVAMRAA